MSPDTLPGRGIDVINPSVGWLVGQRGRIPRVRFGQGRPSRTVRTNNQSPVVGV
jgi:hypothetical protein